MNGETMMRRRKQIEKLLGTAALAFLVAIPAGAASMDLAWDPVTDGDVAGYRIFYDTQPGPNYRSSSDVGKVTAASLSVLADCTYYYVAVKAFDSAGNLSEQFSNQVEGWPHPVIGSLSPSTLAPGQTGTIVIKGSSFAPGAVPQFSGGNVTVVSSNVDSCGQMTIQVSVDMNATFGSRADLTVLNSDSSYATSTGALLLGDANAGLQVLFTNPASGSSGIDPGTTMQVRFSRALDPSTVDSSHFKIMKPGATTAAALAAGSPSVSADGMTVTLRTSDVLLSNQPYYAWVKGGKKGVLDANGGALAADYKGSPFTTLNIFDEALYGPAGSLTSSLTPLVDGGVVPVDSILAVKFTEPIDPSSVTTTNFKITRGGNRVPLAVGFPSLSTDGTTVYLQPASTLIAGKSFVLQIVGGGNGIRTARGVRLANKKVTIGFSTLAGAVQGLGVAE